MPARAALAVLQSGGRPMVALAGLRHTFTDNSQGAAVIKPELPSNEAERLAALRQYDVLDSPAERAFDDLTMIASTLCETQMAAVVLVDEDRQWFKSAHGAAQRSTARYLRSARTRSCARTKC